MNMPSALKIAFSQQSPRGSSARSAALVCSMAAALCVMSSPLYAQIFETNFSSGTIGKYDSATGATINAALVSNLGSPFGVARSGSNLYVADFNAGTVGLYDANTGATINAALIGGLKSPVGLK